MESKVAEQKKQLRGELLRLRVVSAADGDAPEGYTLLASRGQFSYYAAFPSGSPLTIAEVAENFSLLG